jgi:hypothetical protein
MLIYFQMLLRPLIGHYFVLTHLYTIHSIFKLCTLNTQVYQFFYDKVSLENLTCSVSLQNYHLYHCLEPLEFAKLISSPM